MVQLEVELSGFLTAVDVGDQSIVRKCFAIFTKWKLLSANVDDLRISISQSDIYQMYAYNKKYEAKKAILLYPLNDAVKPIINEPTYISKDGIRVKVMFIVLTDIV
ncbi:MAG: McrC family protein [Youngiibacter sp.]|nr:McrC family protein [Youngiibacter sp.]